MSFLWNSDVLIYDSTYDDNNFKDYIGWGHSTWQEATRLAQACKIKNLLSPTWLKYIKPKKYPLWRLDTFFSKTKYRNVKIIEDGGWHFSNLKSPEEIEVKMFNFGHHNEVEDSGLGL